MAVGVILFALLQGATPAHAAPEEVRRIALVIGNAGYTGMSPLQNPRHDAQDLAASLRKVGFEVTLELDLDEDAMKLAIRRFARALEARRDSVGFFYYAGHGVEVGGENYLIPVGAEIPNEEYVDLRAVSLQEITAGLRSARNRLNVVVLDACRDNPFAGRFRSARRGLKAIPEQKMPAETLIAFAAGSGQVAADGEGRNSPFAGALIEEIQKPGIRLVDVFRNVKRRVRDETRGEQNPWQRDDLTLTSENAFYFVPPSGREPSQFAAVSPRRPGADSSFSLGDLEAAAEQEREARESWASRREAMEAAYGEVEAYEKRVVSDALKIQAWERFAAAYAEDDPYSSRDDALRRQASQRIDALQPKYASLVIRSNVSGDTVKIDGRSVGQTGPQAHQLDPGAHTIRVEKRGYAPYEETIQLAAADRRVIAAELSRMIETAARGMVRVPAGAFFSGCNERVDSECDDDEKPGKNRSLAAFSIDVNEVTVADFRECVRAGGCGEPNSGGLCNWGRGDRERHPVNCVDWNQATTYCAWKGKRLPSEWEWEKAARGTDGRKYPWGNERASCRYAVINEGSGNACGRGDTTLEVASKPAGASPYGLQDMSGNVREWTTSKYPGGERRVVRGGSWFGYPGFARASSRSGNGPGFRYDFLGFRCAQ